MATNFVQEGTVLDLAAPYDRTAGQGALIGSVFGVALNTVVSAATGQFQVEGVFDLTKTSAQAWVLGDRIYWDDTNKRCDNDPTKGPLIGVAVAVAANPSSTGRVRLNEGVPGLDEAAQGAQIADLTDNSGGASADGTIGVVTVPTALTGAGSGTANGALEAEGTLSTGGGNTYSDAAVNAVLSKIENNIMELATSQSANITAITAARDGLKELATKVNAILAALRTAGIIKT